MPFEEMARRGEKTLLFGPMKPVGLEHEGQKPYAVVQLRQDDAAASLYNVVGFQIDLLLGEQKRVLSLIPGLENARFARYGVMHRNTYICSPRVLNPTYELKIERTAIFRWADVWCRRLYRISCKWSTGRNEHGEFNA